MRVCLVNPPRIQQKLWGKPAAFQPLDIAYVAAVLEKDHDVSIIDCPTEGWRNLQEIDGVKYRLGLTSKQIAERIRRWRPNLVVITVPFSGWWQTAFETAFAVKSVNSDIKTALIGLHPSAKPIESLAQPNIDFVVIGEPELTVQELANVLEKGNAEDLQKVKGLGFTKHSKVIINPSRPVIEDLDSLPFPARHLLPMKELFAAVKQTPIRGEIRKPCARVLTSRGCPNNCIFCSIHIVMGKKWRGRSPGNVADELEQIVQTYGIKQVDFDDDNMTFNKKRMEAICDEIVKRGLDIEWYTPNGVRADGLDANLLARMRRSGCRRIMVAPESGVQRVVNQIIKKNQDLKKVEDAVVSARKVGIKVSCFFILGSIGETIDDMRASINYAYKLRQLGADRFYFSYATPLVGTELFRQAKEGGYLRPEFSDEALSWAQPLIETPQFTADDLRELCAKAMMVNPTVSRDRFVRALRNPKRAIGVLIGRTKMTYQHKQSEKK
ncbi:MAG TPA: radical SAM protein [Candidatus Bathyarchaeia archaeon]|nr:radical SAM protein [Candidatus Bathyarchaeia archaeon]